MTETHISNVRTQGFMTWYPFKWFSLNEGFCNPGDKALQISGDYSKCQRVFPTRDYCTNSDCQKNFYIDNNKLSDL